MTIKQKQNKINLYGGKNDNTKLKNFFMSTFLSIIYF